MRKKKINDIITIYEDPITEKIPEGKAKLLRKIYNKSDMEFWRVSFLNEKNLHQRTTDRWILNKLI